MMTDQKWVYTFQQVEEAEKHDDDRPEMGLYIPAS